MGERAARKRAAAGGLADHARPLECDSALADRPPRLVTEEEMLHERPDYFQRLRAEGKLDQLRVQTPSRFVIRFIQASGIFALLMGLALLAGMIWAMLGGGG